MTQWIEDQYVQVVGDHITPFRIMKIAKAVANTKKMTSAVDLEF